MTKYRIIRDDGNTVYRLRSNAHDGYEYRIVSSNAEHWEEGDVVELPDGTLGVVSEIRTETFTGPGGEEHDPTEDDPVYIVATESDDQPAVAVPGDDLIDGEFPNGLPDEPEEVVNGEQNANALRANQEGFFEWPESWVESEQPARLIALRAWANMGGRHGGGSPGGCTSTMRGEIVDPDRFCADFKDRILGWEGWRQGG